MLIYNRLKCLSTFLSVLLITNYSGLSADIAPYNLSIYSVNGIGGTQAPYQYQATVSGAIGSGGNLYTSTTGAGAYANGNIGLLSAPGNSFTGPIQAGGNVSLIGPLTTTGNINAGGNLTSLGFGANTINGNVAVAGTITAPGTTITGTASSNVPYTPMLNFSSITQYFTSASNYWAGLSSNTTATQTSPNNLSVTIQAGRNILNIDPSLLGSTSTLTINVNDLSHGNGYLIINGGTAQQNINVQFTGVATDQVLLNLPINQAIILQGTVDSVLAVNGYVVQDSANVDGNLIAYLLNIRGSGSNSVEGAPFIGFAADQANFATPEPSTYVLLGSMIAFTIIKGRKVKLERNQAKFV